MHRHEVISKTAESRESFRRPVEGFARARDAFKSLLFRAGVPASGSVLLPAYIGWSSKEGSGVFDPVSELGARVQFYRVTRSLQIDLEDLARRLADARPSVLLLIHYFGYPDPAFRKAAAMGREAGAVVVEDEAHAMFSDLVGGICGQEGDAVFFSLHKMLPVPSGGMLRLNGDRLTSLDQPDGWLPVATLSEYDLAAIARRRVENTQTLQSLLVPFEGIVEPLHRHLPPGVVPQTFPVVLYDVSRDAVYERMNQEGFGVVSLYHTMVDAITPDAFPDSHWLARRILNLPVHQDATAASLEAMVTELARVLAA